MYHQFNRREILTVGAGAAAIGVNCLVPKTLATAAHIGETEDKVLVVIQLSGGNDGLNTVVPLADPLYKKARPELAISRDSAIRISDSLGLHPSLRLVAKLFEDGAISILQNVGYPQPNRSHFESMDIWHTCRRKGESRDEGWLGRALAADQTNGGDVAGLHLGGEQQPAALASRSVRVPSIKSLKEFELRGHNREALAELISRPTPKSKNTQPNALLDFVASNSMAAVIASERVTEAASGTLASGYPDNQLGEKLRTVAQLIGSGLSTRVYYVQLDGFDTHAKQAPAHAVLLEQWASALAAFQSDIREQGNASRVCCMTFSEFGRRVKENASGGTDHGAAAPLFLCSDAIQAGIHGSAPDLEDLLDGDLKHSLDFRSVYAGILKDWLKVAPVTALGQEFESAQLFSKPA
ncbi:MAG: DUF1501 domain-containing protein [Aureliella sp.]